MANKRKSGTKAVNKKASFNYEVCDELEAGIVLTGPEIKAVRTGQVDLTSSHARIISGEVFLLGSRINVPGEDPLRTRKLLLHKEQITRLASKSQEKGLAIIPLRLYLKHGRAKVLIALGKGKKIHDKRETIKRRDIEREQQRNL